MSIANFIRNRCPSSKLRGKTPYEIKFGHPPDVTDFQKFGAEVYVLNNAPNKEKFDIRGIKGTFLGHDECSKAYRIWIPEERKVRIIGDVKFVAEIDEKPKSEDPEPSSHESEDDQDSFDIPIMRADQNV